MTNDDVGLETEFEFYDSDGDFQPHTFARYLDQKHGFVTFESTDTLWCYRDGVYKPNGESVVRREVVDELRNDFSTYKLNEVLEILKGMTTITRQQFGAPERYINLENGVYDLESDELLPHGPDKMFMAKMPVRYDLDAECPKIKEFLHDIVDDSDVPLLQELIGVCMYRGYPLDKAFMMLGDGENGKSTFTKLLTAFIGEENSTSKGLREILNDEEKRAHLEGKLFNADPDVSNQVLQDTKEFKRLTGGDRVSARKLYEDSFEFYNTATLLFGANELPRTRDTTHGFWRRWILIDFPYRFTNDSDDGFKDVDENILERLTTDEELSGLFNWALDGLKRVLENEAFSTEGNSESVKRKWVEQSDTLEAFLEQCVERKADNEVSTDRFYRAYCRYCRERDMTPHDRSTVGKRIQKLLPAVEKRRKRVEGVRKNFYVNVAVREGGDGGDDDGGEGVRDSVVSVLRDAGGPVPMIELQDSVDADDDVVESVVEDLESRGDVYEPKPGRYKLL